MPRLTFGVMTMAMLLAAAATAQAPRLPTRLAVPTIIVGDDPAAVHGLSTWANLLQDQIGAVLVDPRFNLANGAQISFDRRVQPAVPNQQAIARLWQNSVAIQVITAIGVRDGARVVLNGSIYLGTLPGLAAPAVPLRQVIDARTYQASRDIVMLSTLYALAMNAGGYRPAACPLLLRASLVGRDLARTGADVGALSGAVAATLTSLRCGVQR